MPGHRSPTSKLLFGLILTLATVIAYSFSISAQSGALRRLESDLGDRNRRATLQLCASRTTSINFPGDARHARRRDRRPLAAWNPSSSVFAPTSTMRWRAKGKWR